MSEYTLVAFAFIIPLFFLFLEEKRKNTGHSLDFTWIYVPKLQFLRPPNKLFSYFQPSVCVFCIVLFLVDSKWQRLVIIKK